MGVCQFFLKGDCKFGDRCRNEHPGARPSQISAFGGGATGGFGGGYGGGGYGGGGYGGGGSNFGATNKNVCQFFLKGTCRYGNTCKFAHIKPATGQGIFGGQTNFGQNRNTTVFGGGGGGNRNIPFNRNQNRFGVLGNEVTIGTGGQQSSAFGGNKQQQSSTEAILQNQAQMNQVQQIIRRDMETWDTSKQWPLSCYTYLKDEPCLVGLVDFSPEEIRKEAYDAKKGNKVSAYEQGLKNLLERSRQRRLELKNINDMHQLQVEIRASMSAKQSGSQGRPGMSVESAGQSSSVFGGSAPMSQSQGVFGSTASQGSSGGLFGSASSSQQPMGTTFGAVPSAMTSPANTGVFGSTSPSQPSSLFGSSQASQNTGLFGTTGTMNSGNTLFGATTSNTSPFGNKQSTAGSGLLGTGSTTQPAMNVFGTQSGVQRSNASEISPSTCPLTCSEQDIAAFQADKFVLGQIPECPPPPELCS